MKRHRLGPVIAGVGAVYLVAVSWISSWWYVPALRELGPQVLTGPAPHGETSFNIWAGSGVVGAILVAFGVALYSAVSTFRLLLLAAGSALLVIWLAFWSTSSHHAAVFGIGGGLILLCFLNSCADWARTRSHLEASGKTASDLQLAARVSFFVAAWGLCGLLGAPVFGLRPEFASLRRTAAESNLAVKILVCLVLGWGFTALAQRTERRQRTAVTTTVKAVELDSRNSELVRVP